jgi:hypothetical protein
MEPSISDSLNVYVNTGYSDSFWIYFGILMATIPIQICLDAIAFYLIDAIHSYGMLDFMRFCKYRHANRKEDWVFGVSMILDISVEKEFRSMDYLNFSDQYYFMVGVANWGCIIGIIGIQIITLNSWNFFQDPLWFAFMMVIILLAFLGRLFCRFIQNFFKIWEAPKPADSKAFNFAMHLENYMLKEWNIYEHDAVRHSLVDAKKEWIIENLPKFISKENFVDDNGFLIKVLKRLEDILRKEDIEVVRHNLVEKNAYVGCQY